jgi:hypothetical protein
MSVLLRRMRCGCRNGYYIENLVWVWVRERWIWTLLRTIFGRLCYTSQFPRTHILHATISALSLCGFLFTVTVYSYGRIVFLLFCLELNVLHGVTSQKIPFYLFIFLTGVRLRPLLVYCTSHGS